jgi:hypothetical protein
MRYQPGPCVICGTAHSACGTDGPITIVQGRMEAPTPIVIVQPSKETHASLLPPAHEKVLSSPRTPATLKRDTSRTTLQEAQAHEPEREARIRRNVRTRVRHQRNEARNTI